MKIFSNQQLRMRGYTKLVMAELFVIGIPRCVQKRYKLLSLKLKMADNGEAHCSSVAFVSHKKCRKNS
jgi:hypothetical protein